MNGALRNLYACHGNYGNHPTATGRAQHLQLCKAATAPRAALHHQGVVLQTAGMQDTASPVQQAACGEDGQEQLQQQQMLQQELMLRSNLLHLETLVLPNSAADVRLSDQRHQHRHHHQQQSDTHQQLHKQWQQPQDLQTQQQQQQQQGQQVASVSEMAVGTSALQQQQQQLELRRHLQHQQRHHRQLQLRLRHRPALLTALIKSTRSWQQLQHLFNTFTAHFNPVHVSAAITHLAQIQGSLQPADLPQQPPGLQQLLRDLSSAAVACIPDYRPRQLANSMWAVSRLGLTELIPRQSRRWFMMAFAAQLAAAAPQEISNVALAVGSMSWASSSQWKLALLQATAAKLDNFRPQELANMMYALPLLGAQPSHAWLSDFLVQCHTKLFNFKPQELSQLALGLARLDQRPANAWLQDYLRAVKVHMDGCAAGAGVNRQQHLRHHHYPQHHIDNHKQVADVHAQAAVAAAPVEAAGPNTGLNPQGLVNILWALCAWGVSTTGQQQLPQGALLQPDWQDSCLKCAEAMLPNMNSRGISTLTWALARLEIQPSQQFVSLLLQRSQDLMPAASMTDLAMLVWGLGRLGCVAAVTRRKVASSSGSGKVILHHHQHNQQPVEQRSRLLNATTLLASTAGSSHSSSRSSSSSGAHQQQVLTAAAGRAMESTVTISDSWLCDFQYHSLRVLSRGGVRDFVNLLVGLVRMRVKPDVQWLRAAVVEVHHQLPLMSPTELTASTMCLARLRYQPSQAFLADFCNCSCSLLSITAEPITTNNNSSSSSSSSRRSRPVPYSPQNLANTLGALVMLRCRPPDDWCSQFLAAALALLPRFASRDFSYVIWGLATLDVQPPMQWLDAYLVALRQQLPEMSSSDLSTVIWALAKLNHRPGKVWMQRFLDRVAAVTGSTGGSSRRQQAAEAGVAAGQQQAPTAPVQLSADFSSIILHGITAWAAARLQYSQSAAADNSSSSTQPLHYVGGPQKRTRRHKASSNDMNGIVKAGINGDDAPTSVSGAAGQRQPQQLMQAEGSGMAMTYSRDGSVVFHF